MKNLLKKVAHYFRYFPNIQISCGIQLLMNALHTTVPQKSKHKLVQEALVFVSQVKAQKNYYLQY